MLAVVVNLEPAWQTSGRCAEGLIRAEVAGVSGECTSADLHPDPVPGMHPVCRRKQLQVHRQDLVIADLDVGGGHRLRRQSPDAVHDVA